MAPIGQHVILHTQHHNIIIITNSCYTVIIIVYQVIHTNTAPSYRTINSITQVYVNASNKFVVIIICGRNDGHGHDNEFKNEVDMLTIIIVSLYVPTQSYITIKHAMSCHTIPPSIYYN